MNRTKRSWVARFSAMALAFAFVLMLLPGQLAAKAKKDEKDDAKTGFTVTKWAYKRLNEAHELIGKSQYNQALEVLNSMKDRSRLNDYERALMWQTIGYVHSAKETFPKAIKAFNKCLSFDAIPEAEALNIQFNLGQLYMANKQYKKASQMLSGWIGKVENPTPDSKYLLSMALTQTKEWKKSLYWARKAIAAVRRPQESWLQLELSIHYEMGQTAEMAKMLERLIKRFPRKNYWLQLYAVYAKLKREDRALAVLELCYQQNFLNNHSEMMNLASLYLHHGIPARAASLMEKGIKDGVMKRDERTLTMLGDSWMRAREFKRAAKPLGEAASLSTKGDLWIRVAQLHMEREEWDQATASLQKALDKGNLANQGNAHLLMGITNFHAKKYTAARKAFERAATHKRSKRSAENWLKSVRAKMK